MEAQTKWIIGGVAVAAMAAYYLLVMRPKSKVLAVTNAVTSNAGTFSSSGQSSQSSSGQSGQQPQDFSAAIAASMQRSQTVLQRQAPGTDTSGGSQSGSFY
jgi:hypothetical protein